MIRKKLQSTWRWIEKKAKWLLIATGIIGTALAIGFILNGNGVGIPPIDFNGEIIELLYTDDNSGENLPTWSDKPVYGGWNGADVYFGIKNISGEKQETKIKFIGDASFSLAEIYRLEKDVAYQITVDDYATTSFDCSYYDATTSQTIAKTCEKTEKIGSHLETRYRDEWQKLEDFENEAEFALPKNKIAYFKTRIQFPHQTKGEFVIEITGDKLGFGRLDPWWDASYGYRQEITIATTTDDLINFPILVSFTSTTFDYTHAQDDGDDIRFTSSDGETLIDFEREIHSTSTDMYVYHVEVPSISSSTPSTTIYMYYGNSGASDGQEATSTWDDNFNFVSHFADDPDTSTIQDSTQNDNDGTKQSANHPVETATAQIYRAQDYDGSQDYVELADDSFSSDNVGTLEAWIKRDTTGISQNEIIFSSSETADVDLFTFHTATNDHLMFQWYSDAHGNNAVEGATALDTNWHYVAVTSNGSAWTIYVDGDEDDTSIVVGSNAGYWFNDHAVGTQKIHWGERTYEGPATDYFEGVIDEGRVSNVVRSTAWIKATYNSGNNTLISFGAEEEAPSIRRIMIIE